MTSSLVEPGYIVGVWSIDSVHSDISFSVRHMVVGKVRGRFTRFSGQIVAAENPLESSVTGEIEMASVDTNNAERDEDLRSAKYFDVATYPTMSYRSTAVRREESSFIVDGQLTLHGVSRPVPLLLEFNGIVSNGKGQTVAGFSATAEINRRHFGIDLLMPLDGGGLVVGEKISINLEIEAALVGESA